MAGLNVLFSSPLYPQLKAALNSGQVELAASIYRSITGAGAAEALRLTLTWFDLYL